MTPKGIWRILRLPLFLTAAADVVAGYAVAMLPDIGRFDWHTAALLAGTSSGLYLFGMVENDLMDVRRDRLEGARRPLVTGEIGVKGAMILLVLSLALIAFCAENLRGGALVFTIGTFAVINLYNLGAKRGPSYVAMTVMGLCRLLNFGIGVTAAIGTPKHIGMEFVALNAPLWLRQALALFFATAMVSGYSIMARRGYSATTRVWQGVFLVTALAGFGMIFFSTLPTIAHDTQPTRFLPPLARVLAVLVLAMLWPGGLWSATGPERKPAEYSPFIERAIYWFILMDAAFVLDGLLIR